MNGETGNRVGYLTEHQVIFIAYALGINISLPTTPLRYDQIWDLGNKLIRIQIKHSSPIIKDDILLGFQFGDEKYTKDEIDAIATTFNDKLYLIPIDKCARENKLYFLISKGYENIKWAIDYEVMSIDRLKRILKS